MIQQAIYKFATHPSICKIKQAFPNVGQFNFTEITNNKILQNITQLNKKDKWQYLHKNPSVGW